jgi:hypothetical protein
VDSVDREAGNRSVGRAAAGAPASRSTVVLLGASNVARCISTIVATAQQCCAGPLDLYAAFGHGRSYGKPSSILGRRLPGIVESQLWPALQGHRGNEILALITDVGNDLLYEAPVKKIASWVEACLDRLSHLEARTVLTQLPLTNLEGLSPARFKFFRNVLFPGCSYSLEEVAALAEELNERIVKLGQSYGVSLISPAKDWYGWDPIHVSMRKSREAWPSVLSPWNVAQRSLEPPRASLRRWIYLRSRRPAELHLFGRRIVKQQPCGRLAGGGMIAFF